MIRFFYVVVLLLVFLSVSIFAGKPVFAQTGEEIRALQEDVKSIREGQAAIWKDLQEIKTMLKARPAQPSQQQAAPEFRETIINIASNPKKGDSNAKLVLMEFSDYQ